MNKRRNVCKCLQLHEIANTIFIKSNKLNKVSPFACNNNLQAKTTSCNLQALCLQALFFIPYNTLIYNHLSLHANPLPKGREE